MERNETGTAGVTCEQPNLATDRVQLTDDFVHSFILGPRSLSRLLFPPTVPSTPSTSKTVTMASRSIPQLIFGAASFGDAFHDVKDVQAVLDLLQSHNIKHIDTAGRYPPKSPGRSEELLGEVNAAQQGFTIDTKILAGSGDGSGELTRDKIEASVAASLRRLGVSKVCVGTERSVRSCTHRCRLCSRTSRIRLILVYLDQHPPHSPPRSTDATGRTGCCS